MTAEPLRVDAWWTAPGRLEPDELAVFRSLLPYCFEESDDWVLDDVDVPSVGYVEGATAGLPEKLGRAFGRSVSRRGGPSSGLLDLWDVRAPRSGADVKDAEIGPGLRVGGHLLARLAAAVDTVALNLADELGAHEALVPHLVPWDTIRRAGYDRTFPQHLTSCHVVRPDVDVLDRFADGRADVERDMVPAPVCATPTVCMPLFADLADAVLDGPQVVTARGMCTRHEATVSSTRLWSFAMREIVFVGDRAGAREFRDVVADALVQLATDLGLPARVAPASDPFFTRYRPDLAGYQDARSLKLELSGRLPQTDEPLAIASVNLHEEHFGRAFGITLADGSPAHSACVGFGLDRWARWLSHYVDDDPEQWPAAISRRTGAGAGAPRPWVRMR